MLSPFTTPERVPVRSGLASPYSRLSLFAVTDRAFLAMLSVPRALSAS